MNDAKQSDNVVQTAGRGVIYIALAKFWFLIAGFILTFGLPRIFKWAGGGDADLGQSLYGAYKIVVMGVSFINNGIITGTLQAVSKFTTEDESNAAGVRRTALKVQGLLGLTIALTYVACADLLAGALGSPDFAPLMRLSSGIIVAYSCYAVFIGSFNGQRQFNWQALFDVIYVTMKITLIIFLAAIGLEVLGTVIGFLTAAVIIATAAALATKGGPARPFSARRYIPFAAILLVYTFILNLVLSIDLFFLKGITAHLALAAGETAAQASELSKMLAGRYGAAQGLAFIPYVAIIAIAFVAFPMISKVTFQKDVEKSRLYVRNTMRFGAIVTLGLSTVFAALPVQTLGVAFPAEYEVAANALGVLALGISAFGIMVIGNTILNSAGLPWRAMAVVMFSLVAVVGLVCGLLFTQSADDDPLLRTALGTSLGMAFGMVVSGIVVFHRFRAFVPAVTAVRVLVAGGAAIGVGRLLPEWDRLFTLVECCAVLGVYGAVLLVTREFGKEDLAQLKQVFNRRAKQKS